VAPAERLLDVCARRNTVRHQKVRVRNVRREMIAGSHEAHSVAGAERIPDQSLLKRLAARYTETEIVTQSGARGTFLFIRIAVAL
jgi:hypothetical protein